MKYCTKCETDKEDVEFSKDKSSKDGLCSKCKECRNAYYQDHKEQGAKTGKAWRKANPETHLESARLQREKYPEKAKARHALSHAVNTRRLERKPCEVCGATENIEAHHHKGYEEKYWLDVQWLCRPHHVEADKAKE